MALENIFLNSECQHTGTQFPTLGHANYSNHACYSLIVFSAGETSVTAQVIGAQDTRNIPIGFRASVQSLFIRRPA